VLRGTACRQDLLKPAFERLPMMEGQFGIGDKSLEHVTTVEQTPR
jgi:hypothetical protein